MRSTFPTIQTAAASSPLMCPICGSQTFKPYNGRPLAMCATCKAVERGRLVFLVLEALGVLHPGVRVLHLAPERFLMDRLYKLSKKRYQAVDLEPARFRHSQVRVQPFNACVDLQRLANNSYDLVLHNHVLEHLPCSVEWTLRELDRITVPGGYQVFSVPFRGDATDEDLSPELQPEERKRRFGQADHMRIFGRRDFPRLLDRIFGQGDCVFPIEEHYTLEQLLRFGIPYERRINGHTVFVHQKLGG